MAFIYDRQRQVDRLLERFAKERSKTDSDIVHGFYESQRQVCGPAKMLRKLQCLNIVISFSGRRLDKMEEKDFRQVFEKIEVKYAEQTIHDYVGIIKQFCRWYDGGRYWLFVSWKKRRAVKSSVSSSDLITAEDLEKIIGSCSDGMWKAFIEGLYHSRCRPGEFVSLKRKDIILTAGETVIRVSGENKNSYARRDIIVLEGMPRFRAYVEGLRDPNAHLFPQLPYWSFRNKFKQIVRDSGLKKRVWFYLFRHSKYTSEHEAGAKPTTMNAQYGHAPGSNTGELYYTHLSAQSIKDDLRRIHNNAIGNHIGNGIGKVVGNEIGNHERQEKIVVISQFMGSWANN